MKRKATNNNNPRGGKRARVAPRTNANRINEAIARRRTPGAAQARALLRAQVYQNIARQFPGLTYNQIYALVNAGLNRAGL